MLRLTQYIVSELDEMDREEFFRLKKVQGKKKREAAAEDKDEGVPETEEIQGAEASVIEKAEGDMLSAGKDSDVIF